MKKGKFIVLGLIALVLAGGLALASCTEPEKCPGTNSGAWKGKCSSVQGGYDCTNVCIGNQDYKEGATCNCK